MKKALLPLLLLCNLCWCLAQNPQPYFRNYSTDDGLPSPEVYCVLEDSRGYMWFGTDNGVARFDGYEFKTYGAQEGLLSNVVFDIFEGAEGNIWFGTMTGETYVLEQDTILPYRFNHLIEQFQGSFSKGHLLHVSEDETVYVELNYLGFLIIDSLGNLEYIKGKVPFASMGMHLAEVKKTLTVYYADNQHVQKEWLGRQLAEEGIFYIDFIMGEQRFQKKLFTAVNERSSHVNNMQRLPSGELLVFGKGILYCLRDTQVVWSTNFLGGVEEIIAGKAEEIWFCMVWGGGLRRYQNLEALKNNRYEHYLQEYSVSNMLKDSKGALWVTTTDAGVFYVPNEKTLIYGTTFGFSDDFVTAIAFKNKEEAYVGLDNGDILEINFEKNQIQGRLKPPFNYYHNFSLYYDKKRKTLYWGFNQRVGNQWIYPYVKSSVLEKLMPFRSSGLRQVQPLSDSQLVGSLHGGFYVLDVENHFVEFASDLLHRERTLDTHKDNSNRLWIGSVSGLHQFSFADSTYTPPPINHPAFQNRIEDIDELPDSTLVLGTKGYGVLFWKGDKLLQATQEDGLTSNMVENIYVDENGVVWAGTLNGLNKITIKGDKAEVRTFTKSNGLPSNEIYEIQSNEGQLWLCTAGGLVKFVEHEENTNAPTPLLQEAIMNGEVIDLVNTATFKFNENNFEFRFLAINYRMDGRIPYRYRLDATAPWQYTENRSVNYSALGAGEYAFEVQAQNEDGYWSASAVYSFEVLLPWWKTGWFITLMVGIAFGTGFGVYRYRLQQVRRENAAEREIEELKRSALQAQMNPHFIFNCLNSIQNFIATNDKANATAYLARFAKLVRSTLNSSVQEKISLEEELGLLHNYLALEKLRFKNKFDYDIQVDEQIDFFDTQLPPLLIQPFVENAIVHGLAGKESGGLIKINFLQQNDKLLITITDNGKGIFHSERDKAPSAFYQSVGMRITQKRMELLRSYEARQALEIEEVEGVDGDVQGTRIRLVI